MIEEPKNWIDGNNIHMDHIGGNGSFLLNNMKLSYLKIYECYHSYENGICTICGIWEYPMGDINLDRKVLADLAVNNPEAFKKIVNTVKEK